MPLLTVWRPLILSWGYATLVVDSFGGRGLRGVCANALALPPDVFAPGGAGATCGSVVATHSSFAGTLMRHPCAGATPPRPVVYRVFRFESFTLKHCR